MVGGKAAAEAGAVTHGAVRCSAWLDVAGIASDSWAVKRGWTAARNGEQRSENNKRKETVVEGECESPQVRSDSASARTAMVGNVAANTATNETPDEDTQDEGAANERPEP